MLMVRNGMKPSLESPNRILRGSFEKFGCIESKSFQASPSAGCLKFPSLGHSESCHLISTAVLGHINIL